MQPVEIIPIHIEDYLQGELESKVRHEFYDGQVYAMAGAGEKHNIISGNVFSILRQKARGTDCRTFIADMKLYIPDLNRFYYPDVLLACDPDDNHEYYKQNPCLIIEVLSQTTESIDRREKLHAYQAIPSVKEYLLVSQETMQVELYRRDGKYWQYILLNNHADILQLSCLDLEITMPEIYEDVL
jgi:Uma2 family endonuclease